MKGRSGKADLAEKLRLKDFLYGFSLQVGVVLVCCIGVVMSVIAFMKLCYNPNEEDDTAFAAGSYLVGSVFILLSLLVYSTGLAGSAMENALLLRVSGVLLICLALCWTVLTALSFTNECNIIRVVCVDNRCSERFYLQNSYWRTPISQCQNQSSCDPSRDGGDYDDGGSPIRVPPENSTSENHHHSVLTTLRPVMISTTEEVVIINIEIGNDNDKKVETTERSISARIKRRGVDGRASAAGMSGYQGGLPGFRTGSPSNQPASVICSELGPRRCKAGKVKRSIAAPAGGNVVNDGADRKEEKPVNKASLDGKLNNQKNNLMNRTVDGKLNIEKNTMKAQEDELIAGRSKNKSQADYEVPDQHGENLAFDGNPRITNKTVDWKTGERRVGDLGKKQGISRGKPRVRVLGIDDGNTDENAISVPPAHKLKPSCRTRRNDEAADFKPTCRTRRHTVDNVTTVVRTSVEHQQNPSGKPISPAPTGNDSDTIEPTNSSGTDYERIVEWTPIGDTGSNGHFVLSVVYAVIILPCWYIYPIWLIFSLATQIDRGETV